MAEIHNESFNSSIPIKHANILLGPTQMSFDVTYRCNLSCLHCFNNSTAAIDSVAELSDREAMKVVKDIIKLKPYNVCFCGGEPLIRIKFIEKAARLLKSNGTMVSVVTNGLLIDEEMALRLKTAGVERMQVSLDGATKSTHEKLRNKIGSYDKALNAIKLLKKVNTSNVAVAFTPTIFNCHEVESAIELCHSLGVDAFRIQPLMILGRAQKNVAEIMPTPQQYRNLVRTLNQCKDKYQNLHIEWGDPVDHLIRFRSVTKHLVNYVNIQASGDIVVSPYLPVTVGNVRNHSLLEYWESGLPRIWEHEMLQNVANRVKSVPDFGKRQKDLPIVWFDENIKLDMIDDCIVNPEQPN